MDILIKMIRKVRNVSTLGGALVTFCPRFDKPGQLDGHWTAEDTVMLFHKPRFASLSTTDL